MKFEFLGRDGFWLFAAIKKEYFQKLTQFHFIKHLRLTEPKKKKEKKKAKAIIGGDHKISDFNFYDFYWHSLLIVYFLFYFFFSFTGSGPGGPPKEFGVEIVCTLTNESARSVIFK